jgi:hypothetical protein
MDKRSGTDVSDGHEKELSGHHAPAVFTSENMETVLDIVK